MTEKVKNPAALGIAGRADNSRELFTQPDTQKIGPQSPRVKAPSRGAAMRRLGDLRRVIANGRAGNFDRWRTFGFLGANALCLFRPSRYQRPNRQCWDSWPETTVQSILGPEHSPARKAIAAMVDRYGCYIERRILEAIEEGLQEGVHWTRKHRSLVSAQEAARRLFVDSEEREDLGLRLIGAVDYSPEGHRQEALDRRRERDRARAAAKRRAAGAMSREQYEGQSTEATRPWEALNVSRATYYRQLKARNGEAETGCSPHNNNPYGVIDNSVDDAPVSAALPPEGPSALQPEKAPPTSIGKVSGSEPNDGTATRSQDALRRLPAPSGADGGARNLSLSELALLALYAREKTAGRIREVAR